MCSRQEIKWKTETDARNTMALCKVCWRHYCTWLAFMLTVQLSLVIQSCRGDHLVRQNLWIEYTVLRCEHIWGSCLRCSTKEEDNTFDFCTNTTWWLSSGPSWAVSGWRKHTNTHTLFFMFKNISLKIGELKYIFQEKLEHQKVSVLIFMFLFVPSC